MRSVLPARPARRPRPRRVRFRTLFTALLASALLLLGATGAITPAAAHDGPHPDAAAAAAAFQQVQLARGTAQTGEPMSLAVLPDRTVLHTDRRGTIFKTDAGGTTSVAGTLPVYTHDEEGIQGITTDPAVATNHWIYVYYSPVLNTPAGDAPSDGTAADFAPFAGHNQLSRFTLRADNTIDPASEKQLLQIATNRGMCCHVGGDLDFDAAGNLFMTTGDDSNPFSSDGYSPLDTRASRNPAYDAQRSAANSNDLRGKLLRIHPEANGTYTVPAGNLFAPGTAKTRPEIYAMGFRNPFRMSVDRPTGTVYIGDYGPDAGALNATRGPGGQVEFDRVTSPGFYGWPYCTGTNTTNETYNAFDFGTSTSGAKFDCAGGPVNSSPNNTGISKLPAARSSWIKYDDCSVAQFGCGSESPMGGPVYHYDPNLSSSVKFPQSYDGHAFIGEFGRRWIKDVQVNADGSAGTITDFPWTGTQVMDMAFGPDGALYVLDYGTGFGDGDSFSGLYRIEAIGAGGRAPVAQAAATPSSGRAPLAVTFSSAGTTDPDGDALTYAWDFDGNGSTDSTAADPSHTYAANGQYPAKLTVTDTHGLTGTASVTVTVGNTAPVLTVTAPANGQIFHFGDAVPFRVTVTDAEDSAVDCSRVQVQYLLGHDSHAHAMTDATGCSGTIQTVVDGEHAGSANLFGVWRASYTDNGANGQPALTGTATNVTPTATKQAEYYTGSSGVQPAGHDAAGGGTTVGYIENGDWISFTPYNLAGITTFTARASSAGSGGTLELRADSPTGTLIGSATVPVTGDWNTFTDVTGTVTAPTGTHTLYWVFKGGTGNLYDLDQFTFGGSGTVPGAVQGEAFTSSAGVQIAPHATAHGGQTLGYIDNNDWAGYGGTDLTHANGLTVRVASGGIGGTLEARAGSATGPLLGSVTVPVTGGWENYTSLTFPLTPSTTSGLFLVFHGGTGGSLFDVDDFTVTNGAALTTVTQAESWTATGGLQPADHAAAHGGKTAGYINSGDWATYAGTDLSKVTGFSARVASAGAGGTLQIRAGSATGTVLGTVAVTGTGGWETFADVSTTLTANPATTLCLTFTGGSDYLFDVDDFTLTRSA
ncbi:MULTISPECIES: carbohydrate-binding protein [Streptomyces]|uniref:carbohydrate-binding protein n=1 Tax=Streptomyces TaxID=1883 RepID=UPI003621D819